MQHSSIVARLLAVAVELSKERPLSTREIAAKLECSPKTVQRHRDFLRNRLHLDVEYDTKGCVWRATGTESVLPVVNTLKAFGGAL